MLDRLAGFSALGLAGVITAVMVVVAALLAVSVFVAAVYAVLVFVGLA
jgi:hypothetical protein